MLTDMEESYSKIINNKSICESIRRYMLSAFLSVLNPKFNASIERIKYDIDLCMWLNNHMLHDDLASVARSKYNNMVASNEYSKIDPKDAKIIALPSLLSNNPSVQFRRTWHPVAYLVADKKETRSTKSQVQINVALTIKVLTSNTRGRRSGGAKVINIRTDYLMACMFGTNQKITMHGLISSRCIDLIQIKLQRLLQQLLQRHQNKDQLANRWYLSASRRYYVAISCYLTRTHMNTASKSVNENITLGAGNMA